MRSSTPVTRYLPIGYFALAVALVAALLPSALRPPPQQPPTSAELSPDAPPDSNEVLLTELSRGHSATAGAGIAGGVGVGGELPGPRVELRPRKGRCFGNPPRQVESLYAPPCAAAWVGDNGGATWRGVNANEIRLGVIRNSNASYQGAIDERDPDDMNAVERTYWVYQQYFNEFFELYGRRVRIFIANSGSRQFQDTSATRASIVTHDQDHKVFGVVLPGGAPPAEDEAIKRGLVMFGGAHNPQVWFEQHAPYAYSFKIVADKLRLITAELICKHLVGKPVSFAGDPLLEGQPRKYGIIAYNDVTHYGAAEMIEAEMNRCGARVEEKVYMNFDDQTSSQSTAVTRMRAAGVTTVILATDGVSPIVFTATATNQNYFPEWVHEGSGGMDGNGAGRNYNRTKTPSGKGQWEHSIGISWQEMEMPGSWRDYYRAYKLIDPEDEPDGELDFYELLQYVGAIQQAGPKLTPETFQQGLFARWPSRPANPPWTIGGGYGPGDWTYPDYVSLVWFDQGADDPASSYSGAYCHVLGGQRFKLGEVPTEPIPFFEDCMASPPSPPWD